MEFIAHRIFLPGFGRSEELQYWINILLKRALISTKILLLVIPMPVRRARVQSNQTDVKKLFDVIVIAKYFVGTTLRQQGQAS